MNLNRKSIAAAAVLLAIALVGYWYLSPYWVLHQMRSAVQAHDAESFNAHVDYPKLRDSLKGQFSAKMTATMAGPDMSGNPMAGLGMLLGGALVNQMVDALVRPEVMMQAMAQGSIRAEPVANGTTAAPTNAAAAGDANWRTRRLGMSKLLAYRAADNASTDDNAGFVFERYGFANWKLSEIRLPKKP